MQPEQRRQQLRVVDVGAVRRVLVAAGAGVDADLRPLLVGELVEHPVVQVDERVEQAAGRIELERQARLGEVDLDDRAALEAAADLRRRLGDEVLEEGLARVARGCRRPGTGG